LVLFGASLQAGTLIAKQLSRVKNVLLKYYDPTPILGKWSNACLIRKPSGKYDGFLAKFRW
jgi:hypothetical protein